MNRTSAIVNRQWQWGIVGLVLLAFIVLFPPYDWSFVGDDFVQFNYVWRFMDRPFTAITLLNPYALSWYYRPLQNWWFLANRLTFGFNPFPYYAILSGFHAIAICLVYRTSRQLRLSPLASLFATTLFAIHAHWVDVVGWLSSVAIVLAAIFNLAAVSTYLTYLKRVRESRDRGVETQNTLHSIASNPIFLLFWTAVFFLLALITHEESFLLPAILLIIRRLESCPERSRRIGDWGFSRGTEEHKGRGKLRITFYETALFIAMFLLTAIYLYTQFTRPNLTLEAQEIGLTGYLSHVQVTEIGRFLIDTIAHLTILFRLPQTIGSYAPAAGLLITALLLLWFGYGGRIVQIGLTWAFLHLAFIYFALWTQKPELFAGRHIYQAWIGLVWAIGAGVSWWEKRWAQGARRKPNSPLLLRSSAPPLFLLTAILLFHLQVTHNTQGSWLERAERYRQAEAQVKELLPAVNRNTTVFAHRFPITPPFLPATFQVWYETKINTAVGGGLPQLEQAGKATRDYYLFDYQDADVVNLMPQLQEHEETLFLWAIDGRLEQIIPQTQAVQSPDANLDPVVAGPENDLRVSIVPPSLETAGTWNSLIYPATIPVNSQLQFSLFAGDANTAFRVRLLADEGAWDTLLETAVPTPNQWTNFTIPLPDYWEQLVIIRLESTKDGIWGNPRLVVDP
jgi:hypothetical protein